MGLYPKNVLQVAQVGGGGEEGGGRSVVGGE